MIVVADTSVILNPALVGQEELLAVLFREVFIPPAVQSEFSRLVASSGRFSGLGLPAWMQVRQAAAIPERLVRHTELDQGEMVLGILVRAKRHGQLAAVAPVVEALVARAHFHVAPELLREVLRMAGEAP